MKKNILIFLLLILFTPFVVNAYEVKMDWQKLWGGSDGKIVQTSDDGFIIIGNLTNDVEGLSKKGYSDVIIVKYDKDGNMLWQKSWGGNGNDSFLNMFQTSDGGFIFSADSTSSDIEGLSNKGSSDAIIVKYDKDGNMLWQKSWGGNASDYFYEIFQTSDDGILAYGYSSSTDINGLSNSGDSHIIMVKYGKDGNMQWQKIYGVDCYEERFPNIFQTSDDGFIAYSYSSSTDIEGLPNKGEKDVIIVKYDKDGNLLWQKSWGGNGNDEFSDVFQTSDGNFIAYGYSSSTDITGFLKKGYSDAIIVKYDKDGNILWQKSWGGNDFDAFYRTLQTSDGSFISVGNARSTDIEGLPNKGEDDIIVVKYDKDGNMLWQKSWGGNNHDNFYEILQTSDGGFITCGYSYSTDIEGLSNKGLYDAIIVKYDKDGNIQWQKSFGGNNYDHFYKMLQSSNGEFIAITSSYSTDIEGLVNNKNYNTIIVKYSYEYELEIVNTENGTSTVEQQGKFGIIKSTPNKGYEVDKIIVKDKNGNVLNLELTKLEDETYSFELYDDVSVEVLFKEKTLNLKIGFVGYVLILLSIVVVVIISYLIINKRQSQSNSDLSI